MRAFETAADGANELEDLLTIRFCEGEPEEDGDADADFSVPDRARGRWDDQSVCCCGLPGFRTRTVTRKFLTVDRSDMRGVSIQIGSSESELASVIIDPFPENLAVA